MKKVILLSGCLCLSMALMAQTYNGSDIERMMQQRMQQQSQRNSDSRTNTPQRNYGNNGNSNRYSQPNNSYGMYQAERTIQGVYVYNNQLAVVRLRYFNGKITHYSTSRDMINREQWQSMYPDNPHPTNALIDGQLAREYRYKVSVQGTNIYFNLEAY